MLLIQHPSANRKPGPRTLYFFASINTAVIEDIPRMLRVSALVDEAGFAEYRVDLIPRLADDIGCYRVAYRIPATTSARRDFRRAYSKAVRLTQKNSPGRFSVKKSRNTGKIN